jgi:hypothetical protein
MPQQLFSDIGPMLLQYKETDAFGKQAMLLDAIATAQRSPKTPMSKKEAKQYYQELSYAVILIGYVVKLKDNFNCDYLLERQMRAQSFNAKGEILFKKQLEDGVDDIKGSNIGQLTLLELIARFKNIEPVYLLSGLAAYNYGLDNNKLKIEKVWDQEQYQVACKVIVSEAYELCQKVDKLLPLVIQQLEKALHSLPDDKKQLISSKYDELFHVLNESADDDAKEIALNEFVAQCTETLEGKYASVLKSVLTITAIAVSAVLAGAAGFGIGFALGLWTGPGAFFTAVAGASYAALAVVGASGVSAGIAGTLAGIGLFRPSKELVGVKTFADQIKNIIEPTEQLKNGLSF